MATRIQILRSDLERLRALVEQHSEGRDAAAAERLAMEVDRAVPVDRLPPGVVGVGSRVRFEDERTGATRVVVLVYPSAADVSAGRVSVLAPVGAALLGLSIGDAIEWPLPGGRVGRFRIVSVDGPPSPGEVGTTWSEML